MCVGVTNERRVVYLASVDCPRVAIGFKYVPDKHIKWLAWYKQYKVILSYPNPSFLKYMGHQRYLGAQENSSFNPFLRRIGPKFDREIITG